ncbi:MAG: hypothetical protein H0T53_02830 [Herpetosiphonaceae bacterium]|nr:hypothetical protein [Herpetosiphonaceae bacterium]
MRRFGLLIALFSWIIWASPDLNAAGKRVAAPAEPHGWSATIDSAMPECVLRQSAVAAERTLVLQGSNFPLSSHALQFRNARNQATSILFDMEVNWQSASIISVDMALIQHLLWSDPLLQLDARLIDTTSWPNWVPISDWSPDVLLANNQATCAAGFPPTPSLFTSTTVKVYGFVFNPLMQGQPNIEYGGWNEPTVMNTNYISDVLEASGGTVGHTIVAQAELNAWTPKLGGYSFNEADYAACLTSNGTTAHCATMTDYAATLNSTFGGAATSACAMLEQGAVDEIWWWGGPWFGFLEYLTVDPQTLCPGVAQPFTVMGFNYERTEAEMLHDLGHRAEKAVSEGVGYELWDRFDGQRHRYGAGTFPDVDPADTHCGNVHFAPNGTQHYIRNRDFPVLSDCNDWQNYPALTGAQEELNYQSWYGGNARNEMKWWLSRLPHNRGLSQPATLPYAVHHNWWKYIYPWREQKDRFLPLLRR